MEHTQADPIEVYPSRPKAWTILGGGWILAQSCLTLIPVAPGPLPIAALVLAASFFAVPVLKGIWLLTLRGPVLVISRDGITLAPSRRDLHLPWGEIDEVRLRTGRRTRLLLKVASSRLMRDGRLFDRAMHRYARVMHKADLVLSPWDVDGSLTGLAEQVRQLRDA